MRSHSTVHAHVGSYSTGWTPTWGLTAPCTPTWGLTAPACMPEGPTACVLAGRTYSTGARPRRGVHSTIRHRYTGCEKGVRCTNVAEDDLAEVCMLLHHQCPIHTSRPSRLRGCVLTWDLMAPQVYAHVPGLTAPSCAPIWGLTAPAHARPRDLLHIRTRPLGGLIGGPC